MYIKHKTCNILTTHGHIRDTGVKYKRGAMRTAHCNMQYVYMYVYMAHGTWHMALLAAGGHNMYTHIRNFPSATVATTTAFGIISLHTKQKPRS
jgi:hypothetical protein